MSEQDYGTVRRDPDGPAVRFERRYDASPRQLWGAWTESERIARWLGAELVGGPIAAGRTFQLRWGDTADETVDLVVRELTPPRVLEWGWTINSEPPTLLLVELVPAAGGGTVLVLDHRQLPADQVAGLAAGWHDFLDALAVEDSTGWDERFAALLPAYRERVAALG